MGHSAGEAATSPDPGDTSPVRIAAASPPAFPHVWGPCDGAEAAGGMFEVSDFRERTRKQAS